MKKGPQNPRVKTTSEGDLEIHIDEVTLIDFTKSEEEIFELIHTNHSPEKDDPSFVVSELLKVTGDIIGHATKSTSIVNNIPQQTNAQAAGNVNSTFNSPLCLLKSIACEMSSCKTDPAEKEISVHSRTEEILKKLSKYSFEKKAVVALAAFALEYGDLWHFAQTYGQPDQLTNSVAILKRVSVLIKQGTFEKHKTEIGELNKLIMETYQVIEYICKVEDLLKVNDPKDVPTLKTARFIIPVHSYWAILTIVACAIKVARLTSGMEKPHDLSGHDTKITEILNKLGKLHESCLNEIEVTKSYLRICRELIATCQSITEFIKILILSKDIGQRDPPSIVGADNKKVTSDELIKVLEGKYVLVFISSLDNISDRISLLTKHYQNIKTYGCEIVWIPIEKDWTTEAQRKELQFNNWKAKMPWYAVKYFSSAGRRYLEKVWNCRGNSTAVLVNPQGELENTNVLYLIENYELSFFAFLHIKVESLLDPVLLEILKEPQQGWLKEEKYIFFYGSTDQKDITDFQAKTITAKVAIEQKVKKSIELFAIGKVEKGKKIPKGSTAWLFWSGMEILFSSLAHYSEFEEYEDVTEEVSKLLCYKEAEGGWAMLTRGSTMVTCGQISTMSMTLEKFGEWKEEIKVSDITSFGTRFRENHEKVVKLNKKSLTCYGLEIAGNAPMHWDCPVCKDSMETELVKYSCCHPRFRNSTT